MVRVHPAAIARYLWKGGHPEMLHLFGHPEKGTDNTGLRTGIRQNPKGMRSPVGIPDPVVGIKGYSFILVDLSVKSTVIETIFGNANRPFISPVKGGVKDGFVIVGTPGNFDFPQCLVPSHPAVIQQGFQLKTGELPFEVFPSLFFVDKGDAVPDPDTFTACRKLKHHTGIPSIGTIITPSQHTLFQNSRRPHRQVRLQINIDFDIILQLLMPGNRFPVPTHLPL